MNGLEVLLNYGIAGLILYVFYRLISNELRELRRKIEELCERIDRLVVVIERSSK